VSLSVSTPLDKIQHVSFGSCFSMYFVDFGFDIYC